jgi:hypothetical protein
MHSEGHLAYTPTTVKHRNERLLKRLARFKLSFVDYTVKTAANDTVEYNSESCATLTVIGKGSSQLTVQLTEGKPIEGVPDNANFEVDLDLGPTQTFSAEVTVRVASSGNNLRRAR